MLVLNIESVHQCTLFLHTILLIDMFKINKFPCMFATAGTPKKSTPTSTVPSVGSSEKPPVKDLLTVGAASSDIVTSRTPTRKSYVPVVPSPLLQDTTPAPRPTRACTQRTPAQKRLLESENVDSVSKRQRVSTPERYETWVTIVSFFCFKENQMGYFGALCVLFMVECMGKV